MGDCSQEHEMIRQLIDAQTKAIDQLTRHVNALSPLVSNMRENALLVREIRNDLIGIDGRQATLNKRMDELTSQAMTMGRPTAMIQVGGFVLAVTLLLLNLLGMRIGYDRENGLVIESERGGRPATENADR